MSISFAPSFTTFCGWPRMAITTSLVMLRAIVFGAGGGASAGGGGGAIGAGGADDWGAPEAAADWPPDPGATVTTSEMVFIISSGCGVRSFGKGKYSPEM